MYMYNYLSIYLSIYLYIYRAAAPPPAVFALRMTPSLSTGAKTSRPLSSRT